MSRFYFAVVCCLAVICPVYAGSGQDTQKGNSLTMFTGEKSPAKKPVARKDAFFGLHFDLHPNKTDTSLGADVSEDNIADLLQRVKPDYVQYDCKGHPGYTGYPTEIGWPSPGIKKDSLEIWRKVTREHGVGLFIHYSGVWDTAAIEHNPSWARIDASGKPDPNYTSVFGPYVDELLIPQLNEVIQKYDLDGVWADGECWGAQLDWSQAALEAWMKETGYSDAPRDRSDSRWLEWKMFHRRAFERYLCHWVDSLHKANPGVQLTSNWMYTTFAPIPVKCDLDFLSGDYSPTVSVDRARVEARYLANTGRPWDLMAWGFNWEAQAGQGIKSAAQLQQEASVVLMQGGGFQIYFNPTRSGHIPQQVIDVAGETADFCQARKDVCFKSETIPQVALLLSAESQFDRSDAVFQPYGCVDELEGALHVLLELHYSVDVLAEHQLLPKLSQYPLIVIPDSHKLTSDFRDALLNYVKNGGSLMLLGPKCAKLFESESGVVFQGELSSSQGFITDDQSYMAVSGLWQNVKLNAAKETAVRREEANPSKPSQTAATINSCGKGRIGAVYGPLANAYFRSHHPAIKSLIADLARDLFPNPIVTLKAPEYIELALRKTRKGAFCLHLLNSAMNQRADRFISFRDIPPAQDIEAVIRLDKKPSEVRWVPEGSRVEWSYKDNKLYVKIPKFSIYGILVVQ